MRLSFVEMITVQNVVGRLVEARFVAPLSDEELTRFAEERGRTVQKVASDRVVCIDATRVSVLPPEQSEQLLTLLRRPSPGLLRSAFWLPSTRAVVALQFERLIREAHVTARAFTDRRLLEDWLGEILTAVEKTRLRQFLDENQ
jgi:hypothetical protein